jgi:outer membrane protein assembly factor BamE (lipoprotein component of BamABCDE complex)
MRRRFSSGASVLGIAAAVLILTSCSTPQTRISDHPDLYQSLSPRDQALVSQGQIRYGMSRNAVWLAWGSPDSKVIGNMRGHSTETWVYVYYTTYPYYYYPYYGPYGPGFGFFGDPFYDPFYYSLIPPSIPYPNKTVTFSNSRVMSFQYLEPN